MTTEEMARRIVEFTREKPGASLFELTRLFGEEARGYLAWEIVPNVIAWQGMSQQFLDALRLAFKYIEPRPASALVYWIDGVVCSLPQAKNLPAKGYKTLHWLPVVFYPLKSSHRVTA